MALTFAVQRDDIRRTRIFTSAPVPPETTEPTAVLRVEHFSLTSNNVTYGALGESSGYFSFFPLAEAGWACIPVWGYATVTSSSVPGLVAGERVFGYLPMASEFTAVPRDIRPESFTDGAPHRPTAIAVYNRYGRCASDPSYSREREPELMTLRLSFMTSFVIADYLADNAFFGAEQIVVSSASSKTAYGTAYALQANPSRPVVGLTSEKNRGFVERLGLYERTLTYSDVERIPVRPTAYVDIAGDPAIRGALRRRLGPALVHDCRFGGTHWQARGTMEAAPPDDDTGAAEPVPLLAATQMAKRTKEWGPAEFRRKVMESFGGFLSRATRGSEPWVRFVTAKGPDAVTRVYDEIVSGKAPADVAYVLSL